MKIKDVKRDPVELNDIQTSGALRLTFAPESVKLFFATI